MNSSDPMGERPGRILLNGNAESVERFAALADRCLGPPQHRDDAVRERDTIVVVTAAWGPGELDDGPLRRAFAVLGRGRTGRHVGDLGALGAMHRRRRPSREEPAPHGFAHPVIARWVWRRAARQLQRSTSVGSAAQSTAW